MRNGRKEQHDIITEQGYQLNGIVNHGKNYLGHDIPYTKGVKISKIRTNGEIVNVYFGGDGSGTEKEFARGKGENYYKR